MRILDEFELQGGVALENYKTLCEDISVGDVLVGKPSPEGIAFYKGESIVGYLFSENCLIALYAYNNGYNIFAKITSADKALTYPVLLASLHVLPPKTYIGSMGSSIHRE